MSAEPPPSMYLADTNVVSCLAPRCIPPAATEALLQWLLRNAGQVSISVVTLAELSFRAAELRRRGASRQAGRLEDWLAVLAGQFTARLLPIDAGIARAAGTLLSRAIGTGYAPAMEDALIAATAVQNGLVVLTGDTRDFAALGVRFIDPFSELPPEAG